MAIDVILGFNPSTEEPIDSRFIAVDANDRLSRKPFNCYEGLLVFQQDTNELYICINSTDPSLSASWDLVSDGNHTPAFPFTGDGVVQGSLRLTPPTPTSTTSILTLEGGKGDIITINSSSNIPLTVNSQGLIVLDNFMYTPEAIEGGILYSGSDFYLGVDH